MHEAPQPGHRKRVKHFNLPRHAHDLTFSCYQRMPLLRPAWACRTVLEAIRAAATSHGIDVLAFVLMPEHLHMVVWSQSEDYDIAAFLYAVKRPSSYRLKQILQRDDPVLLDRLTIRERPGKTSFNFWQEGPGYDRNVTCPEVLRSSIQYIHANPVRRGLAPVPEAWPWTSARQWGSVVLQEIDTLLPVNTTVPLM